MTKRSELHGVDTASLVACPLPPAAFAAGLAALPHITFPRLAALLRDGDPEQGWAVATGSTGAHGAIALVLRDHPEVAAAWRRMGRDHVESVWATCCDLGFQVVARGGEGYPAILDGDRSPPPVLFAAGDLGAIEGRRAGVVGTRNATAAGRDAAHRMGRGLAGAGVNVVSGLARGIDGWAHRGAVSCDGPGRPIAVVGSGLDVVYPREHADLWRVVRDRGVVLSEAPPGAAPEAWRFPLRNRIIAALAEVVVVVESRARGGSLITVTEAAERGITVMAVPGGVHSRASVGTNHLLREGAAVAVDADDVLIALSLEHHRAAPAVAEQRPRPRGDDRAVYDVCAAGPRTIEGVALAAGASLVDAAMALARLEHSGWVEEVDGWFEVIGRPLR